MENIYLQFDDMLYKQIVGIPVHVDTNGFYTKQICSCIVTRKSKYVDIIYMFCDTCTSCRSPTITQNLRNIFPKFIHLNLKLDLYDKNNLQIN